MPSGDRLFLGTDYRLQLSTEGTDDRTGSRTEHESCLIHDTYPYWDTRVVEWYREQRDRGSSSHGRGELRRKRERGKRGSRYRRKSGDQNLHIYSRPACTGYSHTGFEVEGEEGSGGRGGAGGNGVARAELEGSAGGAVRVGGEISDIRARICCVEAEE